MSASERNADQHTTGRIIGESTGGIAGVAAGTAIGSIAGPVGAIIGGIAGAVGGWWAGRGVGAAAAGFTSDDDTFYRERYENGDNHLADRSYDDVSPAYRLGHLAAQNPEYKGRDFDSIEPDLQRGWDGAAARTHGEWIQVRNCARDAYNRASGSGRPAHLSEEANDAANNDDNRIDDAAGYNPF